MKMRTLAIPAFALLAALSLSACGGGKAKNSNAAQATAAASMATTPPVAGGTSSIPDCGAVQAVWVNLKTKVYHEANDPRYGKTKHGEYLCPDQAKAQGFRAAGGRRERHHQRRDSNSST